MSTKLPASNPLAYVGLKETNPPQLYFRDRAPTVADTRPYDRGDIWIDQIAMEAYILALRVGPVATWIGMAGGVGLDTLTGDAGGAVSPDGADNINVLGGGGLTVTGNPGAFTLTVAPSSGGSLIETLTGNVGGAVGPDGVANVDIVGAAGIVVTGNPGTNTLTVAPGGGILAQTLTGDVGLAVGPDGAGNIDVLGNTGAYLNGILFTGDPANNTLTGMDLRNITVYVVDAVAGQTEYQTVQAAVDAAQADGGGTVYVRPGIYTEDLVLYDAVDITAAVATPAGFQTTIIGVHTPPAAGDMSFRNLALSDTTDILASAVAGTTTIVIIDCVIDVANGYTFNMPNWTGLIVFMNSHCIGTQDGFADIGAGGANFLGLNSTLGIGATNIMALGGANRINNCNVDCQMDWVGNATGIIRASQLTQTWLVSDNAACVMTDTLFINAASQTFLNHTSTGNVTLSNVTISTDQDPNVITGTGTVIFGSVVFALNSDINIGITKQSVGNVETGPIHIGSGATDPTNHIDIIEEVIADDVTILALNTDNTDPASDTIVNLITGGASAGDPFLHLEVDSVAERSFGIDNSDSDNLKITTGATPSAASTHWQMTTAGERTMPLQPSFNAFSDTTANNATGDATWFKVPFNDDSGGGFFDQNADFNTGTYEFTAPVTGIYYFTATVALSSIGGAHTDGTLVFNIAGARWAAYLLNPANCVGGGGFLDFVGNVIVELTAAQVVYVEIQVSNGAKTVGVPAGNQTRFQGALIA